MTPGSPFVVHCPHCDATASKRTLNSGNTFGSRQWTDLKLEAPMLPHYPDLAFCPKCDQPFLFSKAREADEQPQSWNAPADAPFTDDPTETQWLQALKAGVFDDPKSEQYGRVAAWHCANDPRRESPDENFEFSPAARANLESLSKLLAAKGDDSDALLLRAEIARELGDFDAALALLDLISHPDYAKPRDLLRELAQQNNSSVQLLRSD